MGREDQKEEREVLDSIFPDEIADIDENSFRIAIDLDAPGAEEGADPITLWLTVTYPEAYPDVGPHLALGAPPNAGKHADLDVSEDRERLLAGLEATVEENLGMAMVFTLVSTLKEGAEALMAERQAAEQRERDAQAAALEAKENEKFHGAQVTVESFLEWRGQFRAEMADKAEREREEKEAEDKKKRVAKVEEKLTGKQLWERGLVGKADEEDEGEDDGLAEEDLKKVEKLSIKA